MTQAKFFRVTIPMSVTMPATSTSNPEVMYSGADFLNEWVVMSPGMRTDDSLDHRFEWEDKIAAVKARATRRLGITEPEIPRLTGNTVVDADLGEQYTVASRAYADAMAGGTAGEPIYISEAAFKAGCDSAKAMIDQACGPMRTLHPTHEPKVLRLYHDLRRKSQAVTENEIPHEPPAS